MQDRTENPPSATRGQRWAAWRQRRAGKREFARSARRRAAAQPPSADHASRTRSVRRWGGATMAFLATAAAVISYLDGLSLVRLAGVGGNVAYLYPLLPDGLIMISSASVYEAGLAGQRRPGWALTGIGLGAVLTVGMNVAAGWHAAVPLALVDGVVPVVFFVALEILIGLIRRGRAPVVAAPGPATSSQGEPPEPMRPQDALAQLLGSGSQRALAEFLGVPRSRVQDWAARVAGPVAAAGPDPVLNGQAADA